MLMYKFCAICNREKFISDFRKDSSSPEGISYWCKECSKIWNSIADARRTLKISGGNICEAVNGRRNQASGYRWIYA